MRSNRLLAPILTIPGQVLQRYPDPIEVGIADRRSARRDRADRRRTEVLAFQCGVSAECAINTRALVKSCGANVPVTLSAVLLMCRGTPRHSATLWRAEQTLQRKCFLRHFDASASATGRSRAGCRRGEHPARIQGSGVSSARHVPATPAPPSDERDQAAGAWRLMSQPPHRSQLRSWTRCELAVIALCRSCQQPEGGVRQAPESAPASVRSAMSMRQPAPMLPRC